jgi:hypothetical protein
MVKDFFAYFTCFVFAGAVGCAATYPLNQVLNSASRLICRHSADRVLVSRADTVFPGQTRIACVERKYL